MNTMTYEGEGSKRAEMVASGHVIKTTDLVQLRVVTSYQDNNSCKIVEGATGQC